MKTITKNDLANGLSKMNILTPKENEQFINDLMVLMKTHLHAGNQIAIRKFGTFKIRITSEKTARDINKNEEIIVPSRKKVVFQPSKKYLKFIRNED